jgi:hypothetical protein
MLTPTYAKQFERDANRMKKRGNNLEKLKIIIRSLVGEEPLDGKNRETPYLFVFFHLSPGFPWLHRSHQRQFKGFEKGNRPECLPRPLMAANRVRILCIRVPQKQLPVSNHLQRGQK